MSGIDDVAPPWTAAQLADLAAVIDAWADEQAGNPVVAAVERSTPGEHRWFIRVTGDEKSVVSVWFWLEQRTLHVETYVIPAPEEQRDRVFEYALRRNARLEGLSFAIGPEDGLYLMGRVPLAQVDHAELDRLLGAAYMVTESCFRTLMRLGFASKFTG